MPCMASDVDPAAAWVRAIRTAMTDTGTSQRQLGAAVGVSGSAVDQWLQKAKPPAPDRVFAVERALGLKAGSTSRLLGYLPLDARNITTVEDAVAHAPDLTRRHRAAILDLYEQLRR